MFLVKTRSDELDLLRDELSENRIKKGDADDADLRAKLDEMSKHCRFRRDKRIHSLSKWLTRLKQG